MRFGTLPTGGGDGNGGGGVLFYIKLKGNNVEEARRLDEMGWKGKGGNKLFKHVVKFTVITRA